MQIPPAESMREMVKIVKGCDGWKEMNLSEKWAYVKTLPASKQRVFKEWEPFYELNEKAFPAACSGGRV
jgi:hypothetical protein